MSLVIACLDSLHMWKGLSVHVTFSQHLHYKHRKAWEQHTGRCTVTCSIVRLCACMHSSLYTLIQYWHIHPRFNSSF